MVLTDELRAEVFKEVAAKIAAWPQWRRDWVDGVLDEMRREREIPDSDRMEASCNVNRDHPRG